MIEEQYERDLFLNNGSSTSSDDEDEIVHVYRGCGFNMACCSCNRSSGVCKGCSCVRNGKPCTNCHPSRVGNCMNITGSKSASASCPRRPPQSTTVLRRNDNYGTLRFFGAYCMSIWYFTCTFTVKCIILLLTILYRSDMVLYIHCIVSFTLLYCSRLI